MFTIAIQAAAPPAPPAQPQCRKPRGIWDNCGGQTRRFRGRFGVVSGEADGLCGSETSRRGTTIR
eukprot:6327169-Prymnesium_polylepis.1